MSDIEINSSLLAEIEEKAKSAEKGPWIVRGGGPEPSEVYTQDGMICIASYATTEDAAYISSVYPEVVLALIESARKREKEKSNFDDYFVRSVKNISKLEAMCEWLAELYLNENSSVYRDRYSLIDAARLAVEKL